MAEKNVQIVMDPAVETGHRTPREELHAHGLRYSRAREAILAVFRRPDCGHLSAEALHGLLRDTDEDISLSTVYLNLAVLRDAGLLRELKGASGQSVFDANAQPHYHLVCSDTGDIHDLPAIDIDGVQLGQFLKDEIRRRTGWEVEEPAILLRGRRHDTGDSGSGSQGD